MLLRTNDRVRSLLLSVGLLFVVLGGWHLATQTRSGGMAAVTLTAEQAQSLVAQGMSEADAAFYIERGVAYAQLTQIAALGLSRAEIDAAGGIAALGIAAAPPGQAESRSNFPQPSQVGARLWAALTDPFYVRGTNDMGLGIQLAYSLGRVAAGYLLAVLVAVPLGFVIGMSPLLYRALDPFIQVLKPISPLAWMPIALFTIRDSGLSAVFVIFICSLWPMLINTAFGVASVRREWLNVARTLEVGTLRRAVRVILPAAAPTIVTGMRISIGIAWLVIVAAEMLVGGTGIGYVVWNEWNGLKLDNMIVAILLIGVVGMLLDQLLALIQRRVTFVE